MNDSELVEKLKAGDAGAMEQLLQKHEQRVYRYGLRMCGNEDDARDVLQETLLAAWKNLPSFRGDAQVSTWLFQIARSFCIKQRRRREGEPARHEAVEDAEVKGLASNDSAEDTRTHARQVGELIHAAIQTLQDDQREAVVLRDVEGMSAEEAAEVVGVEVGALKSRLHRGRLALKAQLAAVLDEDVTGGLSCPELAHDLAQYAASEIDQAACARIEKHLETCSRCTAACDALKRTVGMCRALPNGAVPVPVKAAVRNALRRAGAMTA